MAKYTSFVLGAHFDAFVAEQVGSGRYTSATEVVRSGLRLLEEHEAQFAQLRAAILEGDDSGVYGPLSAESIKRQAREQRTT